MTGWTGRRRHTQRGFLFGLPLVLMAITVVLVLLAVRLPPSALQVLLPLGAVVWLLGLYCLVCVPGWLPGGRVPRSPWVRWAIMAVALALALGVLALVLPGAAG